MELVKGIPITEYCDRAKLSTQERLDLFIQVCQAIQHAHQKGIIHRDIKPSNILVTMLDGVAVPKVIDFGIAKATTGQPLTDKTVFTALEQFVGTPAYMSPEQAELTGLDIDTRSDIYSLGVLLYELLTGKTPFDAKELLSAGLDRMRKIIRENEPPRPSTRVSTLTVEEQTTIASRRQSEPPKLVRLMSGDLDWIVMKALEKERTRRYETVTGLAADLKRHLGNEPITARPPSTTYRIQKAIRRNKLAFAAGMAVFVMLVLLVTVSTWQALLATRAKQVANQEREKATAEAQRADANAQAESYQRQRAENAKELAERAATIARRAAARADARYLTHERMLPAALASAKEAYQLGGEWEDGLMLHEIANAARRNWQLSARIPLLDTIQGACFATVQGHSYLAVSTLGGLRVVDACNGALFGSASVGKSIRYLFSDSESGLVTVVYDSGLSVLQLPSLSSITNTTLDYPVVQASAEGTNLLVVTANGDVRLLELRTLAEKYSFNWRDIEAAKGLPLPRHGCVSPDGNSLLIHGGNYLQGVLICDRRVSPPRFTAKQMMVTDFTFTDDTHFATWFLPGGEDFFELYFYEIARNPILIRSLSVPETDTKEAIKREFQGWRGASGASFVGLAGKMGVAVTEFGNQSNSTFSDRYANLLPDEAESPTYLASDFSNGVLGLYKPHEILIFRKREQFSSESTRDYCATACRDGLFRIAANSTFKSVYLEFVPFASSDETRLFSLQWEDDTKWLPWAIAATPDASTVVVIAIDTDSDNGVSAKHKRVRAFVYRPGVFKTASTGWQLQKTFDIAAPTGLNHSLRFAALDSSAHTLVYWNSSSSKITRYDLRDGRSIGMLDVGPITVRSANGERVAAITRTGRLVIYDVATGNTLLDLPGKSASALCFSADGSRIVLAHAGHLTTFDIVSASEINSEASPLLPLAYPLHGNHFVAFHPDGSGGVGGLVLVDTNSQIRSVLKRAANEFTSAFFSESGRQLAVVSGRSTAEVIRSLRPEEITTVLNAGLSQVALPRPLPPANTANINPAIGQITLANTNLDQQILHAEDIAALQSQLGNLVSIEGRVRNVTLTATRNAVNIEMVGPEASRALLVWVPPETYPSLVAEVGPDLGSKLKGRTVVVSGRLGMYGGRRNDWQERFQVTLDKTSKLQIIEPASQTTNKEKN